MMARQMKDSGVEWIGEIPEDWTLPKTKNLFNIGRGRVISQLDLKDSGYPVYSSQTKNNGCLGYIGTYDFDRSQLTWTTDGANAGTVFLREGKHNCTNVCGTLMPKNDKNNLRYMKYSLEYIAFFHKRADTNGYKIMNNEMAEIKITIPPKFIQDKIADFLDEKVGEIDSVIVKTKEAIEDYKKYKQAIITETVTKGLNPDVEMKDSKNEYLGSIPAHWSEKRLRFLGVCQNGISKSSEYFGEGYPFVSYGDVYKNPALPEKGSGLIRSNEDDRNTYSVRYGDVFFTRTSETIEEVGFASTCLKTIDDATFAGFVIRFRPNNQEELIPEFSKYYFRSDTHRKFFVKEMNLVTRASLSQELLKKLPVLLPPIAEQKEIAAYLDGKCSEIDKLIAKKEELLTDLESYKKSLIYEYVTGKKEI
ncbi:type-1 restriction enzyme EcoKI specificity protein [Clostridiales bacterium]|nr:type-1 restriction enzyme EcoKI specificity protein [Clostridiales bacterium]